MRGGKAFEQGKNPKDKPPVATYGGAQGTMGTPDAIESIEGGENDPSIIEEVNPLNEGPPPHHHANTLPRPEGSQQPDWYVPGTAYTDELQQVTADPQENGYETSYMGKWHLDGKEKPGWDEHEHGRPPVCARRAFGTVQNRSVAMMAWKRK